jgi:hypothetical protein
VTPFVALGWVTIEVRKAAICLLLCVSLRDANDIRTDSNDFGEMFHWNLEDSTVLSVGEFNNRSLKRNEPAFTPLNAPRRRLHRRNGTP